MDDMVTFVFIQDVGDDSHAVLLEGLFESLFRTDVLFILIHGIHGNECLYTILNACVSVNVYVFNDAIYLFQFRDLKIETNVFQLSGITSS